MMCSDRCDPDHMQGEAGVSGVTDEHPDLTVPVSLPGGNG
jgi:hypothetical protein